MRDRLGRRVGGGRVLRREGRCENRGREEKTDGNRLYAGTLAPGVYSLTLRATGTNSSGQPVTRLLPFNVAIATASTTNEYVDILGWAVFRITSMDSNAVYGYAISGVYTDINDPALRRCQVARMAPWN